MQRHQDMIASSAKSADPVPRVALAGVAHQFRAFGGAGDERTERVERERRDAIPDLQRDQSGPGNADVEAIVGLAARDIGGGVSPPPLAPARALSCGGRLLRARLVPPLPPPPPP